MEVQKPGRPAAAGAARPLPDCRPPPTEACLLRGGALAVAVVVPGGVPRDAGALRIGGGKTDGGRRDGGRLQRGAGSSRRMAEQRAEQHAIERSAAPGWRRLPSRPWPAHSGGSGQQPSGLALGSGMGERRAGSRIKQRQQGTQRALTMEAEVKSALKIQALLALHGWRRIDKGRRGCQWAGWPVGGRRAPPPQPAPAPSLAPPPALR